MMMVVVVLVDLGKLFGNSLRVANFVSFHLLFNLPYSILS
jgi:hypothetical protein